jgi:hypothetical protein
MQAPPQLLFGEGAGDPPLPSLVPFTPPLDGPGASGERLGAVAGLLDATTIGGGTATAIVPGDGTGEAVTTGDGLSATPEGSPLLGTSLDGPGTAVNGTEGAGPGPEATPTAAAWRAVSVRRGLEVGPDHALPETVPDGDTEGQLATDRNGAFPRHICVTARQLTLCYKVKQARDHQNAASDTQC